MTMGERMRRLRKEQGLTLEQVGDRVGVGKSTVRKWENGQIASMGVDKVHRVARALNTTSAYLMGVSDDAVDYDRYDYSDVDPEVAYQLGNDPERIYKYREALRRDQEQTAIEMREREPKYHNVRKPPESQKVPLIGKVAAGEPIMSPEDYDVFVYSPVPCDAAIEVKGDSMSPDLQDGDILYIHCQADVDDGQIAVVFLDDEALVKHVYHDPDGLTLISDNPKYPPVRARSEDYGVIRIFGVPVGQTRLYKKDPLKGIRKGMPK